MPVSVTMPRLGESVTEGTVTRWLKQEGERVEADEPLLEVSTDKVDTEIPSPAAGVLARIVVGEDETADVGSELAVIAGDGEEDGSAPAQQSAPQEAAPAQQSAPQEAAPAQRSAPQEAAPAEQSAPAAEDAAQQQAEPEPAALTTPSTEKPVEEEAQAPQTATGSSEGTAVKMPALGESVTEGTVTRWLKQVGDTIEVDEPLLEVSTDKVDTEIPSPVAGTVLEIKVQEDDTAEVGADLAIIGRSRPQRRNKAAPHHRPPRRSRAPHRRQPLPRRSRSRRSSRSRRRSTIRTASPTPIPLRRPRWRQTRQRPSVPPSRRRRAKLRLRRPRRSEGTERVTQAT
jgi:pyruvate dehydrogenase E2 component (dihydrolipoamide acetyltransferase)